MLSLYKLEIFEMVVQEGSFSRAAQRLLLSQPAISQHIQDLEVTLGTQLFHRHHQGVSLTERGQVLHDYTQRILTLLAEAESAVTQVENLTSGQIRVGATPGLDSYLLPNWLGDFQASYPNIRVALQSDITEKIGQAILEGRLEFGFVEGELDAISTEELGVLVLREIQQLVLVGKNHTWYQTKTPIPISMLNNHPFITRQQNSQTRRWLEALFQQHGITLKVVGEFDNPETIKRAIISGMGVGILPDYSVQDELALQKLAVVPLANLKLTRTIKLLWKAATPFSPLTRVFLNSLHDTCPAVVRIMV